MDVGLDVVDLILGLVDLNEIGHNLLVLSNDGGGTGHDLDLNSEDSLSEFVVSDGQVDELELGLTGGYDITLLVLLGLCSLSSDLTGNGDFATGGTTSSHD